MPNKTQITEAFKTLQDQICQGLEDLDGSGKFEQDLWERSGGGGGRTRTISGNLIEKGGVNFSEVHGTLSEPAAKALKTSAGDFFATGVSIVLHPKNPWMPIIHMNVRYFELEGNAWWFGGGIDLTPHYIDEFKAQAFHQRLKNVCDKHDANFYPDYKKNADNYFYLPHRNETRGVGGIFFDRLGPKSPMDKKALFDFTIDVGEAFVPLYTEQAKGVSKTEYTENESKWQSMRRGRYVEFNLVWDRGTKFGLETGGRTESILMSLPPLANWEYDYQTRPGSLEAETQGLLKKDIDWINYKGA